MRIYKITDIFLYFSTLLMLFHNLCRCYANLVLVYNILIASWC